ncbi:Retrovirus-related Pol polyprotein from transposon 17.6, partial [Mucuna pruriens]
MVISVVVAKYKVERVLIDQGSSANKLYWSAYMKMGLKPIDMEPCIGKLYRFVEIRGAVELETTFGKGKHTQTILILYMVVDVEASYNIIMGRSTLNKLGTIVSTYHLCLKYPVGKEVGRVWTDHRVARRCYEDSLKIGSWLANRSDVNVLDLDLDPRCDDDRERPLPAEELKEINISPDPTHKTKIETTLMQEDESRLVSFLRENRDMFAWSPVDMLGIDTEFICHRLSISLGFRPVAQRQKQLGEEKRRVVKEETKKLLAVVPHLVGECSDGQEGQREVAHVHRLPSIDRLVDGASGSVLLSFMDVSPQDETKIAFIIDAGAYCYKIFEGLIGDDVEVYVDDMVVKSEIAVDHYKALGRVFQVLRKHRVKLNPEKCSFGVQTRKFLGFMLTERGIEANLEKLQSIINMRSPETVKEVQ